MRRAKGPSGQTVLTRRELIAATGLSAAALAALAACQPATTGPTTSGSAAPGAGGTKAPKIGGTLIINQGQEPNTLLPYGNGNAYAGNIFFATANRLVRVQLPEMSPTPDLAESWTVSADGTTYTFKVRKGVKWHDGNPFTLEDIKYTYETLSHPDRPGGLPSNLANIVGAQDFKDKKATTIAGITTSGDDTVVFKLKNLSAIFLVTVASSIMVPKHILSTIPVADHPKSAFARKPILTGPFMVSDWKNGEGVVLTAFKDHFAGRPRLDTIISRGIPDAATGIAELRAGSVQVASVLADQFGEFDKDKTNYTTQRSPGTTAWYMQLDPTNVLFSDRNVREAMAHTPDRKAITDALFAGTAEPNYSLVSPLSYIYNPQAPKYEYDPAKAKQLLDAAGWTMGADGVRVKNGKRFEWTYMCSPRTAPWAAALQPYFKTMGIPFQIQQLDFGTIISKGVVGGYEGFFQGWGNFTIDPRIDLQANFLHTPPPSPDTVGYANPKVDDLFVQGTKATEEKDIKRIYGEIQSIVEGDVPFIHLWRIQDLLVVRNTVKIPPIKVSPQLWTTAAQWEAV